MSSKMSPEEVKKLFKKFDNGNGHLSLAELEKALITYYPHLHLKKNAIMRAYKAADSSGNGFVELREFGKIMDLLYYYQELSETFSELDNNGDHRISFAEFKRGFELLGEEGLDDADLKREFNKIDTNKGGFILFDEFCIYMANRKLH